jgi:hypothetical protein
MIEPHVYKLIKWAMILLFFGYVPMNWSLKILRHNGFFEVVGSAIGLQ